MYLANECVVAKSGGDGGQVLHDSFKVQVNTMFSFRLFSSMLPLWIESCLRFNLLYGPISSFSSCRGHINPEFEQYCGDQSRDLVKLLALMKAIAQFLNLFQVETI